MEKPKKVKSYYHKKKMREIAQKRAKTKEIIPAQLEFYKQLLKPDKI